MIQKEFSAARKPLARSGASMMKLWCDAPIYIYILVGGWPTPLENINEKDYPIYEMENWHVPILGNVPQIMPKMGIWAWKKTHFFPFISAIKHSDTTSKSAWQRTTHHVWGGVEKTALPYQLLMGRWLTYPSEKMNVNGKDYPIYYGKYIMQYVYTIWLFNIAVVSHGPKQ